MPESSDRKHRQSPFLITHCIFWRPSLANSREYPRNPYIAEARVPGLHFCCQQYESLYLRLRGELHKTQCDNAIECITTVQGYPRPLISVPTTNRKIVINVDFSFHNFGYTATSIPKIATVLDLSHSLIKRLRYELTPSNFCMNPIWQKRESNSDNDEWTDTSTITNTALHAWLLCWRTLVYSN